MRAIAYDNELTETESAIVQITVVDPNKQYEIISQTASCSNSDLFHIPIVTSNSFNTLANVIGFDMVMSYESSLVMQTGVIKVNSDLIYDYRVTDYAMRHTADSIWISLFFNSAALPTAHFHGHGQVLAIEFVKKATFPVDGSASFTIGNFVESYRNGTTVWMALSSPVLS